MHVDKDRMRRRRRTRAHERFYGLNSHIKKTPFNVFVRVPHVILYIAIQSHFN